MDTSAFLRYLEAQSTYGNQIVHIEHILSRQADSAELEAPLEPGLQDCLEKQGILSLYTHQAEAVNHARQGENVMVSTSSASGKSLCYNISVLQAVITEPASRAFYLFPTKALAQDQLRVLQEMFYPRLLKADEFSTFDGDTPQAERAETRKRARIILTNPDMLHIAFCPTISPGQGSCEI